MFAGCEDDGPELRWKFEEDTEEADRNGWLVR